MIIFLATFYLEINAPAAQLRLIVLNEAHINIQLSFLLAGVFHDHDGFQVEPVP